MKLKAAIAALALAVLAGGAGALYYYGRLPGLPGRGAASSQARGTEGVFGVVTGIAQGSITVTGQDGKKATLATSERTQAITQPVPGVAGETGSSKVVPVDQIPLNAVVLVIPDKNDAAAAETVLIFGLSDDAAGSPAPRAD
jgi:hypothetical protein